MVAHGASPSDVLGALLEELRRRSPTVVVLEDLHWADEATLDVVRLLARRVTAAAALVVATHRDELDRRHPLRIVLGELPHASAHGVVGLPRVRCQSGANCPWRNRCSLKLLSKNG